MMSGSHGNPACIEHLSNVEMVNAFDHERQYCNLVLRRTNEPNALHTAYLCGSILQQLMFVLTNSILRKPVDKIDSGFQCNSIRNVRSTSFEFIGKVVVRRLLERH